MSAIQKEKINSVEPPYRVTLYFCSTCITPISSIVSPNSSHRLLLSKLSSMSLIPFKGTQPLQCSNKLNFIRGHGFHFRGHNRVNEEAFLPQSYGILVDISHAVPSTRSLSLSLVTFLRLEWCDVPQESYTIVACVCLKLYQLADSSFLNNKST